MRYAFGSCTLDTASRQLTRDGQDVHLSPKAFELLRLLVEARPRVVAKAEIMQAVWPDAIVVDANLPVLVGEVRAALGDRSSASSVVRTHHSVGYSFIADAREARSAADRRTADGHVYAVRYGSRKIVLGLGANSIGRDPACDVHLNDPSVSKVHARIMIDERGSHIADLESKNGTSVQGTPIVEETPLADGDEIGIGVLKLFFIIDKQADTTTATL
jgi:DNA-binding winged helix-turn-helix (wHTH) protein